MVDIPLVVIQIGSLGMDVLWCAHCLRLLAVSGKGALERSWKNLAVGAILTAIGIGLLTVADLAPIPRNFDALGALSTAVGAVFMIIALRQQQSIWREAFSSKDSKNILEAFAILDHTPETGTAARRKQPQPVVADDNDSKGSSDVPTRLGQKVLIEFDPTSDYDAFLGRRAEELLYRGLAVAVFTKQGSVLSETKGVKLVLLSFSEQSIKLGAGGNLTVSITNPSLILETFTSILKSDPSMTVIIDNITDLTIDLGFERTYNLLQGMGELVAGSRSNLILLLNPKAHDEKIRATFEGYSNVILRYDKTGIRTEKGVVDLSLYAEE